ncbi:sulfotransferase family protein [Marinobacter sp.]|uniref:sulfotransferase family protein n=1 Tax=Marinobacter sp. TaxID=50741 RepID=UPI003563949D
MPKDNILPPSVFILGAPKCGTTSLAWYLNQHPQVVEPKKKEPNFFSDDLPLQEVETLDEYLRLFEKQKASERLSFEASTWYLYSEVAAKNIKNFDPDSKLIVLIRNPIEMVQSLHSQQLYNLHETIFDFEQAWYAQFTEERKGHWLLQYKKCCETGTQLSRLLTTVDKSRLKVILFDDLKSNPERVFLDVQSFVGIDEFKLLDYSPKNSNKTLRSRAVQEFTKNTPKPLVSIVNVIKKLFGIKRIGLSKVIERANKVEQSRGGIRGEFKAVLVKEFEEEISKLELIVERDLSHWKY